MTVTITTRGFWPFRRWVVSDGDGLSRSFSDKYLAVNYAGQFAGWDWSRVTIDGRPITPADSPAL